MLTSRHTTTGPSRAPDSVSCGTAGRRRSGGPASFGAYRSRRDRSLRVRFVQQTYHATSTNATPTNATPTTGADERVASTGCVYRLPLLQVDVLGVRPVGPVDVYRPSVEVPSSGPLAGLSRWVVRRAAKRLGRRLRCRAGRVGGGHGESGVGVAEAFGYDLDGDAGGDGRGVRGAGNRSSVRGSGDDEDGVGGCWPRRRVVKCWE